MPQLKTYSPGILADASMNEAFQEDAVFLPSDSSMTLSIEPRSDLFPTRGKTRKRHKIKGFENGEGNKEALKA